MEMRSHLGLKGLVLQGLWVLVWMLLRPELQMQGLWTGREVQVVMKGWALLLRLRLSFRTGVLTHSL